MPITRKGWMMEGNIPADVRKRAIEAARVRCGLMGLEFDEGDVNVALDIVDNQIVRTSALFNEFTWKEAG